jgi:hypothetical protein
MTSVESANVQPVNGVSYAKAAALDDPVPSTYAEAVDNSKIPAAIFELTNGSHGGQITPPRSISPLPTPTGDFEGAGLDESPKTPIKRKRPLSRNGNASGSLRQAFLESEKKNNSDSGGSRKNSDTIVYEKLNHVNGTKHLTSVKPEDDYNEALRLDKTEAKFTPDGELVLKSGKIPSAGWERSGYVTRVLFGFESFG